MGKTAKIKKDLGCENLYVIRTKKGQPVMFDPIIQPVGKEMVFGRLDVALKVCKKMNELNPDPGFIVCQMMNWMRCIRTGDR